MNALTKYQTINDAQGMPAFVVIPYEDFQKLREDSSSIDLTDAVPSAVVDAVFDKGISALKAWREHLEMTQTEVAERAGMTQSAYSQHEQSDSLSKAVRAKLSAAMGLTAEQLNF